MKVSVFWFRRDLRLHDNAALHHALKGPHPVIPLFIFDTQILNDLPPKDDPRVSFIYTCLEAMQQEFVSRKTSLLVRKGTPQEVFKRLLKDFDIAAVYTNHDYEPYAIKRDNEIAQLLTSKGISFHTFKDQVIFEKHEILTDAGLPYKVYTHYKNKWKALFKKEMLKPYPSDKGTNYYPSAPEKMPGLEAIGFQKTSFAFPPKELDTRRIKNYDQTRNFPALDTTRQGLHLRFGTLSIREAVQAGMKYNETWLDELIWREFFMQLLFHFQEVVQQPFNKKMQRLAWRYNEKEFKKWCQGQTGYPIVDAGMRELNATGFMHNRVRMVCASFLAKHLLLDWKLGEQYFADRLLDFELSSNNGNWQWVAGTGADAQPFFRIFNPTEQQKKFDPEFIYIKKWIPEFGTSAYPEPMVEHKFAVERAKKAFASINSQF